jgi:hypothetical protein
VTPPAPFAWVLVHSPATGPLLWQGVAERLRAAGHRLVVSVTDPAAAVAALLDLAAATVIV